jgi:hypothetical protein
LVKLAAEPLRHLVFSSKDFEVPKKIERQLLADSVEKVGHGFYGRKIRA